MSQDQFRRLSSTGNPRPLRPRGKRSREPESEADSLSNHPDAPPRKRRRIIPKASSSPALPAPIAPNPPFSLRSLPLAALAQIGTFDGTGVLRRPGISPTWKQDLLKLINSSSATETPNALLREYGYRLRILPSVSSNDGFEDSTSCYHGTPPQNLASIINHGFRIGRMENGRTYGEAIYATPCPRSAFRWSRESVKCSDGLSYHIVLQCRVKNGEYSEEVENGVLDSTQFVIRNPAMIQPIGFVMRAEKKKKKTTIQ